MRVTPLFLGLKKRGTPLVQFVSFQNLVFFGLLGPLGDLLGIMVAHRGSCGPFQELFGAFLTSSVHLGVTFGARGVPFWG